MDPVTVNLALAVAGVVFGALGHWRFPILNRLLGNGNAPPAPTPPAPSPAPAAPAVSPFLQIGEQIALAILREKFPNLPLPAMPAATPDLTALLNGIHQALGQHLQGVQAPVPTPAK